MVVDVNSCYPNGRLNRTVVFKNVMNFEDIDAIKNNNIILEPGVTNICSEGLFVKKYFGPIKIE